LVALNAFCIEKYDQDSAGVSKDSSRPASRSAWRLAMLSHTVERLAL